MMIGNFQFGHDVSEHQDIGACESRADSFSALEDGVNRYRGQLTSLRRDNLEQLKYVLHVV